MQKQVGIETSINTNIWSLWDACDRKCLTPREWTGQRRTSSELKKVGSTVSITVAMHRMLVYFHAFYDLEAQCSSLLKHGNPS